MTTFDDIINYSPENKKVFEELSGLCINKLIVPYIGAGMSVFAGFKTWNKFINDEYENCFHTKKPDSMNNIVAADLIEQEQGKDIFYENVRITFGGNLNDAEWENVLKKAETQAISIVPKLFYGPIITTNFDQIIENIHDNKLPAVFPYNSKELGQAVDNRKRLIYKIHGCVSDAQNVVFTKSVYDKVYSPYSELMKSLSVFFQGFHFLFLGSSLGVTNTKGDTKDYSMDVWEKLQNSGTYHFAILDCTEDQISTRREELEERNIYPILFESGKYESVKIILDELLARYENQLFGIPQYTSPFVERKESVLGKIANHLHDDGWSAHVITGFGGVGKTRVLSEYANRKQKAYKHIIWFNAISADNVREEIFQFALKNKLIIETEKDYNYIYYVFKKWMKENEDWLFLLDNVEHCDDIKAFFDFDKTLRGKRHILISSRNKDEFSNIQTIPIDVFEIEESREFLESHTNKTPDDYADKIADRLGGLPLALEQAAAYIKEENESYKGYYELLEKDTISILEKKHLSHTESVGATWNISMQRIKSKAAKELLNLCAFFAPDSIHSQWFVDAVDVLSDELRKNGLNDFAEIKKELKAYSLVRIDSEERISMHRLLQDVVRKALNNKQEKLIVCIQIMNKQIYFDFSTAKSKALFQELILHILSVTDKMPHETADTVNLKFFLGYGFNELANYPKALELYQEVLIIIETVFGAEHPYIFTIYNNIGFVYYNQADYAKAIEFYQKALIREKVVGIEDLGTAQTYNNIGLIYIFQGNNQKGLEYLQKSLQVRKKILGDEHPDIAQTYNNIGLVFHDINYSKALKIYSKAIEIYKKTIGINHLNAMTTYYNIAEIYRNQGDYLKSLVIYKNCLLIHKTVLGIKHPKIAELYYGIGLVYDNQGKYLEALKMFQRSLRIFKETLGINRVFAVYNKIISIYFKQNNLEGALDFLKKSLSIVEKELGINNTNTATIYYDIAGIYYKQNNYKKALHYFWVSYNIFLHLNDENSKKAYNMLEVIYKKSDSSILLSEWLNEQMQK